MHARVKKWSFIDVVQIFLLFITLLPSGWEKVRFEEMNPFQVIALADKVIKRCKAMTDPGTVVVDFERTKACVTVELVREFEIRKRNLKNLANSNAASPPDYQTVEKQVRALLPKQVDDVTVATGFSIDATQATYEFQLSESVLSIDPEEVKALQVHYICEIWKPFFLRNLTTKVRYVYLSHGNASFSVTMEDCSP